MTYRLELQFLPAVLEIQETPPSPIGRSIIWVIVLFFICVLIWGTLGRVDIIAVASGKIIPSGHVKVIQPLEIGAVTAIHVREGQKVVKGELLIELDSSVIDAQITQLKAEQVLTEQQIQRLQWLIERQSGAEKVLSSGHDSILHSQWQEYQDQLDTLAAEKQKIGDEYAAAGQQKHKLEAILAIIEQRSRSEKTLLDKNLFPRQQFLETERQRLTTLYDLKSQKNRLQELEHSLDEITARIEHTHSSFTKNNLEKREQARRRLRDIGQELVKAHIRQQAQQLIAPIDGIVQQLAIHTVGGIVTPAQQLMVIVPQSAKLEIEAYVKNKDIGFVHEGQSVAVKLDAFPFTRYGTLDGKITDVSDDAVSDENKGLIYKARVSLEQTAIQVGDKQLRLSPGMAASVEIKTGRRRLIEFFLAPLLKYKDESIRER